MSSPCSQRPQRRRQHASLSGRTDSTAESDEETKVANERRRRSCPMVRPKLMSKHECVGHVQKRMGTALREKAKEKFVNERRERVRMRWKGRITDKTIKLLTRYYGKAIRSSTGFCAAVQDAAWEIFFTIPSPQHHYCPSGQRS